MRKLTRFSLMIGMLILCSANQRAIELKEESLFDNKVLLKIPNGFEIMSEENMKVKYPSENRPSLVFSDETGGINVALNYTQHQAKQESILPYKKSFVETFKKLYPSAAWKGNDVTQINGRNVGYLEFVTPAIDAKIYNLMFFTALDGRLLLCTFNCTEKSMKEWKPVAHEIMNSLKVES